MKMYKEITTFDELYDNTWSGGTRTLDVIASGHKEDEIIDMLEDIFYDQIPSYTDVNDFLWFDDEYIFEQLFGFNPWDLTKEELEEKGFDMEHRWLSC